MRLAAKTFDSDILVGACPYPPALSPMRRLLSSLLLMMKLFATGPTAFESVAATAWVNDRVVRWLGQTVA